MKFTSSPLLTVLALAAYVPGILASLAAANGTAVASNSTAEAAQIEEQLDNSMQIDESDIQGSLSSNVEDLLFSMGVCSFDSSGIFSLGVNDLIQLALQLQQLQQLQALGIVNSFAVEQLIQQELFLNNFSLSVLKRTIRATVRRAAHANKRTVMQKRACEAEIAQKEAEEAARDEELADAEELADEDVNNEDVNNEDVAAGEEEGDANADDLAEGENANAENAEVDGEAAVDEDANAEDSAEEEGEVAAGEDAAAEGEDGAEADAEAKEEGVAE